MEANKLPAEVTGKLRVLIIDDEKNIRTTLKLCLEQLGCEVGAIAIAGGAARVVTGAVTFNAE